MTECAALYRQIEESKQRQMQLVSTLLNFLLR